MTTIIPTLPQKVLKGWLNKFEEKLKEFIIDEHEIEEVGECARLLLKSEILHFHDRLEIVYKYTRLYFKDYDKQDVILEKCEGLGDDKCSSLNEDTDPNAKKYSEIMDYLEESIEMILEECKGDVTMLDEYLLKKFLEMTSIFIVGLKFPQKYGFL